MYNIQIKIGLKILYTLGLATFFIYVYLHEGLRNQTKLHFGCYFLKEKHQETYLNLFNFNFCSNHFLDFY